MMAQGRRIGLDKYYHELGYELYGSDWDESYIKLIISSASRDRKSIAFKRASKTKDLFYKRINKLMKNIEVVYRNEQGYAPATFAIEGWFIHKSECFDKEGYSYKCRIFVPKPESRGRKAISEKCLQIIYDCVLQVYPNANKKTEDINVTSIHACVKERVHVYNQKSSVDIATPSVSTVSNYVRKKYPNSRKKSRNSKK